MSATSEALPARRDVAVARLPRWWPLVALTAFAALLRFSTLGVQSLWFDEAFTPLHVLHPSLIKTLEVVPRTENSPPLWYVIEWFDYRLFGSGAYALRLPSAILGTALVPVAWAIGRELADRAAAVACAALVAVGPLFVWYSQEARTYALFMFTTGLAMLAFVRVLREPSGRRMTLFAVAGALCLLSHYFAVFILAGMGVWLLADPRTRRRSLPALAALGLVALALLPLISAQGGRGTQWIGEWALKERIEDIADYYLTGYSGGRLGHSAHSADRSNCRTGERCIWPGGILGDCQIRVQRQEPADHTDRPSLLDLPRGVGPDLRSAVRCARRARTLAEGARDRDHFCAARNCSGDDLCDLPLRRTRTDPADAGARKYR